MWDEIVGVALIVGGVVGTVAIIGYDLWKHRQNHRHHPRKW
jgi:predicted negative regulator of RcsB-dependent stress response